MSTTGVETRSFVPSAEWIKAFSKEHTDSMRRKATRYARWRLRKVNATGAHISEDDVVDLVQSALTDILGGVVSWRPEDGPLLQIVRGVIRSRTWHEAKRAEKFRHQRFDALDQDADARAIDAEVEASLALDHGAEEAASTLFSHQVIDRARALAARDPQVLALIDAVIATTGRHADLIEATKLSPRELRNARLRLRRVLEQVDTQVENALRRA